MQLLDGKETARALREEIAKKIQSLRGRPPGLAFVIVGQH